LSRVHRVQYLQRDDFDAVKGRGSSDKDLEKGRSAMDDQVLQKVKQCAVDYLGVRMDDIVSVAEVLSDDATQHFDVRVQGREVSPPQRCIVVVKDGQASI